MADDLIPPGEPLLEHNGVGRRYIFCPRRFYRTYTK
jgi:hypothetical protein